MKIYVAAHCRWAALYVSDELHRAGHEITSRWINNKFNPTEQYTETDRQRIAEEDIADVLEADTLVLVAGPDKYTGGKFVEAGIAMGANKWVIILGRRENMLLWDRKIAQVHEIPELIELLNENS